MNSGQVLIITPASPKSHHGYLYTFQKAKQTWQIQFIPMWVSAGRDGFVAPDEAGEGWFRTITGIYRVEMAFGTGELPDTAMKYQKTWPLRERDSGPCGTRGGGQRRDLYSELYQILLRSKEDSARTMTLHLWRSQKTGTAGSIGMSELNMLKLLKWLDSGRNPIVIVGSPDFVKSLK